MAIKGKTGVLSVMAVNTGTYGSPVWDPYTNVGDLKVDATWDTAEAVLRSSRIKRKKKTVLDFAITGKVLTENMPSTGTSDYKRLLDAFLSDTVLDVMVLNGPSTENGVTGYRMDVEVTSGSQDQGPTALLMDEFALVPVLSDNPPQRVVVTSGAPVFSDI